MQRLLLAPKLFYFWWFMALGAFAPFISLYYRSVGLNLAQIGLIVALPGLPQMLAAPIWGVIADALRIHRILLPIAVFGTLLPIWLIGQTSLFSVIMLLTLVQAIFAAPITPLADSATLTLLGEQRERYGAQRVWGAVGWGISTLAFGWLVERFGLGITFPSYALLGVLAGLAALLLPGSRIAQVNLRAASATLLRDRRWGGFLVGVFLIGCASSSIIGFLSLYLQDLGAGGQEIGFAVAFGSITELPVMALAPLALRRWGARPLIIGAGIMYALRATIYVVAPTPEWVLLGQVLHGPCFAALWAAGVDEAQRLAPPGMEATAQSLFGTVYFGLASTAANAAGGWLYRDFGYQMLFGASALLSLLGAASLFIVFRTQQEVIKPAVAALPPQE